MRKLRKRPTSAGLAGLISVLVACGGAVLVACGGGATNQPAAVSTPTCVNASAPHKAYVVVQHQSGATTYGCVGFATDKEPAADLMAASGISFKTQHFSFGDAACAIDGEPASFDTCFPKDAPTWALWTAIGGTAWQMAQVGYGDIKLSDGEAIGWRYTSPSETNPSPPPPAKK